MIGTYGMKRLLRDDRLIIFIFFAVSLDLASVLTWSQSVGFTYILRNETQYYDSDTDKLMIYQSMECWTPNASVFFVLCCSWKLFLISFGLFLAWRIHGVKIKVLNESKFIGSISYIIVISTVVVGTIHFVGLTQSGVTTYMVDIVIVMMANTLCLLLNFMPRVLAVHRGDNANLCSNLFVDHGGVRRLQSDYNEHVSPSAVKRQNTLLKGEMTKLDEKLTQLGQYSDSQVPMSFDNVADIQNLLKCLSPKPGRRHRRSTQLKAELSLQNSTPARLVRNQSMASTGSGEVVRNKSLSAGKKPERKMTIRQLVGASSNARFILSLRVNAERRRRQMIEEQLEALDFELRKVLEMKIYNMEQSGGFQNN